MKLATARLNGVSTFGAVTELGFVDLAPSLGHQFADLRALLAAPSLDAARRAADTEPATALNTLVFERPIPNLDARMLAVGWAYKDHQTETGKAAPEHPFFFSKHPQAMVGHGVALQRPRVSERFDFEGEIAIVIGKAGRHIPANRALEHVAGYTIVMDGSVRDWQAHSVTAGKNFDASSAYGPWIVTRDDIAEPGRMELVTRVNGQEMQRTFFSEMAWRLEDLVAYASTICRLEPGDCISTGTPAGVGNKRVPPVYLKAGDTLSIEVSGIGELSNPVIDEPIS
ncbi:fumarylacetoacetate hydrolase family protein [Hydrogenophaga sp. BPS33]|uniref:fumarylacetoacetate hydrolase family protein n=1 Tax=Hydrogenophaga sp. BPS33 TaxID=2651974 RepID=UPI001358F9EB|nr:fumarylacetoacetate hydrolase family protein [Hydrogenophaga sp. BPS33]